jgi:hypothetical protein
MSWGVALRNAVGLGLGGIPSLLNAALYPRVSFNFLSGTLDSRITFTRASTGSYFNSSGVLSSAAINEPRFDYDPVTLAPKGLLIEEQRTNLCLYSEDLNQASWAKGANVTATYNTIVAPDGNTTADTLTISGTDNGVYQSITVTASTTYTWTWWVKLGTLAAADFKFAIYNNTGAAFIAQNISPTETLTSTGWTRVNYSFSTPVGCTSVRVYVLRNGTISAGTVNVWGMQLEQGAFSTSYIPTTTTALTRSADVASVTGANFSNWYNATEGTLFVEANIANTTTVAVSGVLASIGDSSTFNESMYLARGSVSTNVTANVIDNGVAQWVSNTLGTATLGTTFKAIMAYKLDNFGGSVNAAAPVTDNAGTIPTVNSLMIGNGSWSGASNWANGYIRSFKYYPTRLRDSALQALTR